MYTQLVNLPSTIVDTPLGAIEYSSYGVRAGSPTVLALHGAMGGYDQGLILARSALGGDQFGVLAASRPGYLGTPLSSGRSPELQADLCAGMLDTLGMDQVAVIAISGGGQCALQLGLRHPRRCWALVMVSACSAQLTLRLPLRFHLMKLVARFPSLVTMMRRQLERDPDGAARRSIADSALRARTLRDPEAGPLFRALQLSTMDRLARRMPGTLNDIEQSRRPFAYPLESIQAPTLVVHGVADRMAPFSDAQSLARRLPAAELMAIENGEHVSLFTHREAIRTRITDFLIRHKPGAPAPDPAPAESHHSGNRA